MLNFLNVLTDRETTSKILLILYRYSLSAQVTMNKQQELFTMEMVLSGSSSQS